MKKYIQEATDINIWTSLKENTFDRGDDIKEFIEGLELIEGNAYISLNAKWGDGKTFFVRQVEEVLKYLRARMMETDENPLKNIESYDYLKDSKAVNVISVEHLYLPVYYNAWMYDNHNDPLLSLLFVMTKQCGGFYNTNINVKSLGKRLAEIVSSLPVTNNPVKIVKDFNSGNVDILAAIKTEEDIKECVKNIFNDIIVEKGEKLVIFIDELDRCKPSFAIEMLERIKHYFDDERIIFVVSLNKEQLTHTISNYYGNGFDATRYLNRFFDIPIHLPEIDSYQRKRVQCQNQESFWIVKIANELSSYYQISLRDALIYKSRIEAVPKNVLQQPYGDNILLSLFVPIIVLLGIVDVREEKRFLEGKSDFFEEVMIKIRSYRRFVLKNFGDRTETGEEQCFAEGCELIKKIYNYAFGTNNDEIFDEYDVSRDFKMLCINTCNATKR